MLPPPGLEPSLVSLLLENATPTSLLFAALNTAASLPFQSPSPVSSALSTSTAVSASYRPKSPENGECRLLGPFAIFVQGALGCLALLALVYKRWRERPQRPMKIWSFDVSKQVVGSVLVHIANLLMSLLSSGQLTVQLDPATVVARMVDAGGKYRPNPCSFYLLNLAIDTTIGIPILIFLLRILTFLFALTPMGVPLESITSGNYGTPPRTWWWFKQSMIYFLGLMGMKICVLIIFLVLPWISRVGDWALRWTEGDEALQVIFVMLVFPVIMNATQYYIIDSFIKNQNPEHELIPDEDTDSEDGTFGANAYADPRGGSSDGVLSGDEDEELKIKAQEVVIKHKKKGSGSGKSHNKPRGALQTGGEYDPLFDGDYTPTIVGSASTSERERDRLVAKEVDSDTETNNSRAK